jgi:hypothetical protein
MYRKLNINQEAVLYKAELLLKIYKPVVWSVTNRVFEVCELAEDYSGEKMEEALEFLANYAPEHQQNRFQDEVASMFETKWLIQLVNKTMKLISSFPDQGELYHEIISKKYLADKSFSENEILEELQMGRSTFYDKRNEALNLFGICMWGYALPVMQGMFEASEGEGIPCFFK